MNMQNFKEFNESSICTQCQSDPCICDDSHGFVSEAIDKEHPIVKEYDSLKKNHDIKSLRGLIKGQHRIVDTSEYKTKDHAISAYLRSKHGDKKVDKAFGFNKEEAELGEASNDYFARRKREEDIISGKKPARKKTPAQTSDYQNRRDKEKMKEEVELDEAAQGHTIEAHGIRGMKGTPWRKTFKSHEHLSDWADKNDSVEVHATRELDGVKKKTNEELSESSSKHRVGVTVSEPDHPMVSKRKETQQKFVKVSAASKEDAVAKAKKFYSKQGYHVHGAEHHSMVSEEIKSSSIPSFKQFIE
jgi:hypothetical protein